MSSVNVLVGCLAVMGSVQLNKENGDPPQDIQHPQQQDGAPPQQVRPPQQDRFDQWYSQLIGDVLTEQHQIRRVFKQGTSQQRKRVSYLLKDGRAWYVTSTNQLPKRVSNLQQTEQQQKLFQKDEDSITVPQFSYLIQCMILAGLVTSILIKTLLKNQQSNQEATKPKKTSEHQTDQQQSQAKQHSHYTGQEEHEARQLRSIVFAVPSQQSVDILKSQHVQARVAKLLADLRKQLQAVATESAPAACKQRLFNRCAGGLQAAALC